MGCACIALLGLSGRFASAAEPAAMFTTQGDRIVVPANSPLRQRLSVSPVSTGSAATAISLPAVVEADPARVVAVLPPLAGRLVALHVGIGTTVRRGETLAELSSPDFAQALSDAAKADDALVLANKAFERARGVALIGANAGKDLEAADAAQRDAVAEDRRARDRVSALAAGAAIDPRSHALVLRSPVNGTVTALGAGAGGFLNDLTAPLMVISDLHRVFVTVQVPEEQLGRLVPGAPVEVLLAAYPGQVLHATTPRASPLLEPDTRRAKLRIAFDNADGRLRPNMFATATLKAKAAAAGVSVPPSALMMNNDSTTVLVEVAPWTFKRLAVTTGAEDEQNVQILAGLKAGDRVVTRGGVLLND
jgi:cobalt-zinc-cadmium efflux system membrane fusion protein